MRLLTGSSQPSSQKWNGSNRGFKLFGRARAKNCAISRRIIIRVRSFCNFDFAIHIFSAMLQHNANIIPIAFTFLNKDASRSIKNVYFITAYLFTVYHLILTPLFPGLPRNILFLRDWPARTLVWLGYLRSGTSTYASLFKSSGRGSDYFRVMPHIV